MSGLIPQPFIDELIHRTDIVEFIDAYVPLKKRGVNYIACCPFHHEKTPSFNVVAKKQFYHCFGCNSSGNVISFAMNYLHLNFSEAIETLASKIGLEVPREGGGTKQKTSIQLVDCLSKVALFYQNCLRDDSKEAISYLKKRGLNADIVRLYQIGYAREGWHHLEAQFRPMKRELIASGMLISKEDGKTYDRYRQRIMFPIHDTRGRVIAFGGRAIQADQTPKYLNSPETSIFQKSHVLYGLYQVLEQQKSPEFLIVVEGYMDVIALAQYGIRNAVATLGTATSVHHLSLMSKYTKKVVFCFDGDNAGRQAAWRALETSLPELNQGVDLRFVFLPQGHDPDSLVRTEGQAVFLQHITSAIPVHQLLIDTVIQDIDCTHIAGKTQLIHKIKPYLLKISEGPYRQLLLEELARMTHLEVIRIEHLLLETEKNKEEGSEGQVGSVARTPSRVAIALLLQHPELYAKAKVQIVDIASQLHKPKILKSLLEQVSQQKEPNTAQLIEAWRNTPYFDGLLKLAVWEHRVPEQVLLQEFIDILVFLAKQTQQDKIQALMQKTHEQGLTDEERLELQTLLKVRHGAKES